MIEFLVTNLGVKLASHKATNKDDVYVYGDLISKQKLEEGGIEFEEIKYKKQILDNLEDLKSLPEKPINYPYEDIKEMLEKGVPSEVIVGSRVQKQLDQIEQSILELSMRGL